MKISLICPIYNEKESISYLIESMLNQSKSADEIIFVDSFSTDGTTEIIEKYSKKNKNIRLIKEKSNISKARNIAIENSKNEIIAATDASCELDENWLKNITEPFKDTSIDVVSGGYRTRHSKGLEKYLSLLSVKPLKKWDEKNFLPSGRSIAFRKKVWKKVGGYPEEVYTGEDTLFALKLKNENFKFKMAKNALVTWKGRTNIKDFAKQFYLYGKGDGQTGNIYKLKLNLTIFLLFNFWIFAFFYLIIFKHSFFLIWLTPILFLTFFKGVRCFIETKDSLCLFFIPPLFLIKRVSYFFGIWKGLF